MEQANEKIIERIKLDQELRPYFFDFVCKGFVLGLSDTFEVSQSDRLRFQKEYYERLIDLSNKIEKKTSTSDVLNVVYEVSTYYLKSTRGMSFEEYNPKNK